MKLLFIPITQHDQVQRFSRQRFQSTVSQTCKNRALITHQNICQVVHTVVFTMLSCLPIDREGIIIVFRILFLLDRKVKFVRKSAHQMKVRNHAGLNYTLFK